MHKKKILSLGLAIIVTIGALVGCSKKSDNTDTEATLKEVEVSIGTIKEEISLSGSIVANKSTAVNATSKSTVEEIYVQSGEEVLEGEDIILLEDGTVIEAPYDGRVTKISTSVNQDVDTSTTLFTVIDDNSYKIEASIDESEVSKVSHGQDVDVTITALNKSLEGTVTNVDAQATSNGSSATFGLVVTLEGKELEEVYSGMSAEMSIIIKESKDVLTVPIQAVSSKKGVKTVKVKDGDSTKEVEVEVGAQDSSFVEIKSGLNEGDVVVYEQATKTQSNNGFGGKMDMMGGGDMSSGGGMPGGDMSNGERPSMPSGERPSMPSN